MFFTRMLTNNFNSPRKSVKEGNAGKFSESRKRRKSCQGRYKTMKACQASQESVIYLMVQSPDMLFGYWDAAEDYLTLARNSLNDIAPGLCLRLVHVSQDSSEVVVSQTMPDSSIRGNYYFSGLIPHATYFAELGFSFHGGFFTLLRSNMVHTPPDKKPAHGLEDRFYKEYGDTYQSAVKTQWLVSPMPFVYSPTENMEEEGE
jgi:hypothetical protein